MKTLFLNSKIAITRILAIIMISFLPLLSFAQTVHEKPEMADGLRSNGKIWVVVLVVITIFIGIVAYLFSIEKRLKNIEKNKELL